MHPALYALLGQQVRFKPLGATDKHGQATFGAPTKPVPCHISYPKESRRRVGGRADAVDQSCAVYIDPCDFPDLLTAVPVGSIIVRYDGGDGIVAAIEAHYAPPEPEIPGIDGLTLEAAELDHWKVVVAP